MYCKASVLLALATSVAAHMRLDYPVPYSKGLLTNAPLAPSDFPCKHSYTVSEMNKWNAGETKEVSFLGSAVHGGGSCQFSLTTDLEPTEASQWKVIHSIVGGCPANVPGNLKGEAEDQVAPKVPVTMPDSIPDGKYTFAWTWLNKVGNREFYMDCAPVQVGSEGSAKAASASAASALSALPDMFVANLPATECATKEGEDFVFPDPGQSVFKGTDSAPGDTRTGAGCVAQAKMGAGSGQMAPPTTPTEPGYGSTPVPSSPAPSEPAASASAAPEPVPSKPAPSKPVASEPAGSYPTGIPSNPDGGVYAPGASPAPAAPTPEAPKPQQPTEQPSNETAPTIPNTPASGACTPCTTDGAVVCIGSNQFGLCNRGCAVPQDLSMGMVCANGVISGKRRSIRRFPRAHLHRRHGSGSRLF